MSEATSVTDATRPVADEHTAHSIAVHPFLFVSSTLAKVGHACGNKDQSLQKQKWQSCEHTENGLLHVKKVG
jgi:hypothetical protein